MLNWKRISFVYDDVIRVNRHWSFNFCKSCPMYYEQRSNWFRTVHSTDEFFLSFRVAIPNLLGFPFLISFFLFPICTFLAFFYLLIVETNRQCSIKHNNCNKSKLSYKKTFVQTHPLAYTHTPIHTLTHTDTHTFFVNILSYTKTYIHQNPNKNTVLYTPTNTLSCK